MGVVYAAFDSQLDRKVAIKLLRPTLSKGEDSSEAEARLLREAQAMARLSHPNVVAIHDVGIVEGNVFLAMEYVEGGTLKDRLTVLSSWREGLALLKEAGRGLAAAHDAGLIHRDFKPDNVLVGSDGRVRVTDFGIARADEEPRPRALSEAERRSSGHRRPPTPLRSSVGGAINGPPSSGSPRSSRGGSGRSGAASAKSPAQSTRDVADPEKSAADSTNALGELSKSADSTRTVIARSLPGRTASSASLADPLTLTGDLLGTVGYMAPEQAFGERIDARSDQFSFCVTLYYALYREKPFRDPDIDTYLNALTGPVRDAPAGSKVPQWIRRILLKGLSLSPAARYASMDELLAALDHDPAVARRRWATTAGVAACGVLAALAYQRTEASRTMRCASTEADLAGVWDAAVKEDTRRAFDATGIATQADSFERVAKALDACARRGGPRGPRSARRANSARAIAGGLRAPR